jgi:hypothetical protein
MVRNGSGKRVFAFGACFCSRFTRLLSFCWVILLYWFYSYWPHCESRAIANDVYLMLCAELKQKISYAILRVYHT